jgi:hypothetical protein
MPNEEQGPEIADESSSPMTESALNANTELRKRRSTRIVQAVPLNVTGVDALGRPFTERTSTLIINCHGCRYQSKHYVLKNMWVNLEVPSAEPGHTPRRVRGKVAWIQRPRTVRQLFQVALELETPGNAWGIAFPPEDWFTFPENATASATGGVPSELPPSMPAQFVSEGQYPLVTTDAEAIAGAPDNLRVFPAPASATDASMQLARQVARLLAEAKQQIQALVHETATQSVAAERRIAAEQWEQKYASFRDEVTRETARAVETIQQESSTSARTAQASAAESLKAELPRWLAPQLEQMTHELTAQLAREGALQREQQEKQLSNTHESLQALCAQAEQTAEKLREQAVAVESQTAAHIEEAARKAKEEAQQRDEAANKQFEALIGGLNETHQRVTGSLTEAQNAFREQLAREVEAAQSRSASTLEAALQTAEVKASERFLEKAKNLRNELVEEVEKKSAAQLETIEARSRQLEETLARANQATEKLEHYAGRVETVREQALNGFQSQLDDVLSLHRNELHRQSDSLFEEIHSRISSSFEAANSKSLETFDAQIQSMVLPHVTKAEEAVHRLAGGRSLLDAAMTMQQDRIRNSADEAFADSLARFRENLGSVEQILNESAQTISARNMEELESKAVDLKHHTMEEMFKSAEWYEKKAQTQAQTFTEKLTEQSAAQLREKAGEISSRFATELDHSSRSYLNQTQHQLEDSVRDAFERVRILFTEAADTTSAAFTDEIQRNARQELDGFNELMQKSVEISREKLDVTRVEIAQKVSTEQEEFLRRFHDSMSGAVEKGLHEAQGQVESSFAALLESWKSMNETKQDELRGSFGQISNESAEQYRNRLENITNTWMVATVATLDHQSRDVIAKIATSAEERLREATAEVFAKFGETLRERLQQIASGFEADRNLGK